jgi:tRNA (Thr-GGU) A37 N-methylase
MAGAIDHKSGHESGMIRMQPIGFVRSPYKDTAEVPKGLGAKHEVEGALEIRAEFEPGLADIDGFSHLFVIWVRPIRRIHHDGDAAE